MNRKSDRRDLSVRASANLRRKRPSSICLILGFAAILGGIAANAECQIPDTLSEAEARIAAEDAWARLAAKAPADTGGFDWPLYVRFGSSLSQCRLGHPYFSLYIPMGKLAECTTMAEAIHEAVFQWLEFPVIAERQWARTICVDTIRNNAEDTLSWRYVGGSRGGGIAERIAHLVRELGIRDEDRMYHLQVNNQGDFVIVRKGEELRIHAGFRFLDFSSCNDSWNDSYRDARFRDVYEREISEEEFFSLVREFLEKRPRAAPGEIPLG